MSDLESNSEVAVATVGGLGHHSAMSTLAEVEAAVVNFPTDQLAELERFVRKTLKGKAASKKPSLRNLEPVSVGKILRPLGSRDEWYGEMLEERV